MHDFISKAAIILFRALLGAGMTVIAWYSSAFSDMRQQVTQIAATLPALERRIETVEWLVFGVEPRRE